MAGRAQHCAELQVKGSAGVPLGAWIGVRWGMDLGKMLEKCRREQWQVAELDWSLPPREMPPEQETAVVQYFTDMAGIERLAGALFREQRFRTKDPVLAEIFASFEKDELRHSHVAQLLADHYDVHKYRTYFPNEHMQKFAPHFVSALRYLSPEIANVYITTGELILDIALLRSLDDYVADEMSHRAMELINRDESRHIAIDFHMAGYYASEEYLRDIAGQKRPPLKERAEGFASLVTMLWFARPFFRDVFFRPMDLVDPSGKRLREAFKRVQLLGQKPGIREKPFIRFMQGALDLFNTPVVGFVFGSVLLRVIGCDPRVVATLYDDGELQRAKAMTFDELAEDALAAKLG